MKKWWFLLLCLLGISTTWYVFYPKCRDKELAVTAFPKAKSDLLVDSGPKPLNDSAGTINKKSPEKPKHLKETYGSYFFFAPILKFSSGGIPCLMIQVEGQDIIVELDLGLRGEVAFSQKIIERIKEKTFVGERKVYGARGKSYQYSRYKAPKIQLANLDFRGCIMEEDSEELLQNAVILSAGPRKPEFSGRIGWELFVNCNLFLDLANSNIAFCDSVETLETQGYPMKEFAKIPLHTERGFVEMLVEGSEGTQIWALDTGATWNILNTNDNTKTIEEMALNPRNHIKLPLKIGDADFGFLPFCKIPIPLPIHVDAMLGMEFFKKHQVFIDFYEKQIYISNPLKNTK